MIALGGATAPLAAATAAAPAASVNFTPPTALAPTSDRSAISPTPGGAPVVTAAQPLATPRAHISSTAADCAKVVASAQARVAKGLTLDGVSKQCVSARQLDRAPAGYTAGQATAGKSLAAAAVPSYCDINSDASSTWWAGSRRSACQHTWFALTVVLIPSGEVIGTATFHAINTMTASTSKANWAATTYVWVWSWTGVGFPESSRGALFGCPGDCLGNAGSYTHPAFDEWRGAANFDVFNLAKGAIKNNVSGKWEITMGSSKYGTPSSVTFEMPLAPSRCDNAINRPPGCVFGNISGLYGYSQSKNPAFVDHIYKAQLSGLPGRMSTGTYLTRLTNQTQINANGTKACPVSLKRPTGYTCDEYPFRSTREGASTGGGLPRSFPGCRMPDPQRTGSTGWSRCFIPASQNSSAGGLIGGFYANERMLAGDLFEIGYTP